MDVIIRNDDFSLPSCGKKDNATDETLIDPDYIIQEYVNTTTR